MAQDKLVAVLLQPDGNPVRLVVSVRSVAALPSSVVKLMLTDWLPVPTAAMTWPVGETVAVTLLFGVAE